MSMSNNIKNTEYNPKDGYPIEISKINLRRKKEDFDEKYWNRKWAFTSAKYLIFSASSVGIMACDIEKATPPMNITIE